MVLLVATLAGCGESGSPARTGAATAPAEVRTDAALLATCVELPAEPEKVRWRVRPLGVQGRAPGPTDHQLEGVVRLVQGEAARLRATGVWEPDPSGVPVPPELAPGLDAAHGWTRNLALEDDAAEGAPHFLLNQEANALYVWALNPRCGP
ncbi:hypothetical protein ACFY8O_23780 [Streptomyces argenteolus]|uniref:Lipoprotein n=1 Tax=Streptomyces argenteolus TaxID=67274 RepID=A0ABW6XBB2_9ACTN